MSDDFTVGSGPHLAAAFLCEKVLQEKDNVLTFVRVVDRFFPPRPTPQMPASIQTVLVVSLKAGDMGSGKAKVTIRPRRPDEGLMGELHNEVFFEGGKDHGVNIVTPMFLVVDEEGLYWIDVLFEDKLITRVPMRVLFQTIPQMIPGLQHPS